MSNHLLIVFVKNAIPGTVKTRLAKSIGNEQALQVYLQLLNITEQATLLVNADVHVYYSKEVEDCRWEGAKKFVQVGADLGERMSNAFLQGFEQGYEKIVLIGSDLPQISKEIIEVAFNQLSEHRVVLGPAHDGGYYLVGQSDYFDVMFKNKTWSHESLLKNTINDLKKHQMKYSVLSEQLNDIDTLEDFRQLKHLFD